MKLICIQPGKCLKQNAGLIEINVGDEGNLVEKEHNGSYIGFINGTRILISTDHINKKESGPFACFKTIKESKNSYIKNLENKLEEATGKKVSYYTEIQKKQKIYDLLNPILEQLYDLYNLFNDVDELDDDLQEEGEVNNVKKAYKLLSEYQDEIYNEANNNYKDFKREEREKSYNPLKGKRNK